MSTQRMGLPNRGAGLRLLDLGCGTGASTAALLDAAPEAESSAVDASAEMLAQARRKVWPERVRFVHGRRRGPARPGARTLRRDTGRLPGAQPGRAGRRPAPVPRPAAAGCAAGPARVLGARLGAQPGGVDRGLLVGDHPDGLVRTGSSDLYRYLWRSVLRFDGVTAAQPAAARGRVRRRPGADRAGLATAHRAHRARSAPVRAGSGRPARPRCADLARGPPDQHRPGRRDPADGHGPAEAGHGRLTPPPADLVVPVASDGWAIGPASLDRWPIRRGEHVRPRPLIMAEFGCRGPGGSGSVGFVHRCFPITPPPRS